MEYQEFLESKIKVEQPKGIKVNRREFHHSGKPHQNDIIEWLLNRGAGLCAADTGMGKSHIGIEVMRIVQKTFGGKTLIVTELGASETFVNPDPEVGEGARLGIKLEYVTNQKEAFESNCNIVVTNYERVRNNEFDFGSFTGVWLDEGNYLKNMASETTNSLQRQLSKVRFKYVATATPSPNETLELINYAHSLGITDRGQILTRFFQRNSTKAGELTLHPQHEDDFWMWVYSWAIFIQRPSDLGYDDEGYNLPPLNVYWHEVRMSEALEGKVDRDGQKAMFISGSSSLPDAAKIKRNSINDRLEKALEVVGEMLYISVQTYSNENNARTEQRILRSEQREGERAQPELLPSEQRKDRSGSEEGLYEGVSENLQAQKIDAEREGGAKPKAQGTLCTGRRAQAESEATGQREQQTQSIDEAQQQAESCLWNNDRTIQSDAGTAGGQMCDMRHTGFSEIEEQALCRPRPQDGQSEGHSLSPLQLRIRSLQGQHRAFTQGGGIPEQIVFWCHLNEEQKQIEKALKEIGLSHSSLYGSLSIDEKHTRFYDWIKKSKTVFLSKPEMFGCGVNLQQSCKNILLGINHSFDEFYQLIKRTHRYGQTKPVEVHAFYTPEEYEIVNNLKRKWEEHDIARAKMREIVLKYGLNQSKFIEEKKRSFKVDRKVFKGESYTLYNNDCVFEFKKLPDHSVDMILTSIPFGNHYEYSDKYNDFGHNTSNEDFFKQMDFLVPELLRVLKPGRIAAIHTKNRIHYGSVTGKGFSTFHRFTHKACDCFEKHGFETLGFHYVPTDVVAENNQTYRLGFGEMKKDATKMGSGIPEEIWLFRKAPSSTDNAYADEPVTVEEGYTLAHWQADADSFWKSSGNRLLMPHELKRFGLDKIMAWWKKFNKEVVYDYDEHVKLLQSLDENGKLSRTFTTLPLQSNTDFIWNDVNRMHGLNMEQSRRKQQNHICPMPFDEVDRLIKLYSMPGETIADPFAGLCTTGVRAIKHGRKAILTELNEMYAKCGSFYLKHEEYKNAIPTLFDLVA